MQDLPILSRRVAAVICLALVGSLNIAASPTPDIAAPEGWLPGLVDSREISSPTVAEGVVLGEDGQSPAAGVQVALYGHPSPEHQAAVSEGRLPTAALSMTPLAKTMTDHDGSFTLRINPTTPLHHLWSADGVIDAVVVAGEPDGAWVPFAFSMFSEEMIDGEALALDGTELYPESAVVDRATGTIIEPVQVELQLNNPDATRIPGVVVGTEDGESHDTPDAQPSAPWQPAAAGPCPNGLPRQVWSLGKRKVVAGEIHVRTIYGYGRFIYRSGASSTLEVAFSTTGTYGSFSGSGTATRSSSLTSTSKWYKGIISDIQDTEFVYHKVCFTIGAFHYYEVEAAGHAGGRYPRAWSTPSADHCVRYPAGETITWEEIQSTAYTFGAGAKLAGSIGIDLSARTGFNSKAVTEFDMEVSRRLCGSHGYPGITPRRLILKV